MSACIYVEWSDGSAITFASEAQGGKRRSMQKENGALQNMTTHPGSRPKFTRRKPHSAKAQEEIHGQRDP